MKNTSQLRRMLAGTIQQLRDGNITPVEALAVGELTKVILQSAKLDLDYQRQYGSLEAETLPSPSGMPLMIPDGTEAAKSSPPQQSDEEEGEWREISDEPILRGTHAMEVYLQSRGSAVKPELIAKGLNIPVRDVIAIAKGEKFLRTPDGGILLRGDDQC